MDVHSQIFYLVVIFALFVFQESLEKQCPRDKSRTVASVVRERLLPVFHKHGIEMTQSCPFSTARDMYAAQEDKKIQESGSRWTCDFCGKAFVSEFFLDQHFDNRHIDKVQRDDSICLADVCDVFRCEIISGASIPDFWDVALCLEDDMIELANQCEALLDHCIPDYLSRNKTITVKSDLKENVCSFLTCKKFWNTPFETTDNSRLALYIILASLTTFGIIIYNFVFYNYFYSDLLDPPPYDPSPRKRHKIRPYPGHRPQD